MATINYQDGSAAGAGGARPLFQRNPGRFAAIFGTFDFDSSYPTGGEDLSDLFAQFKLESGNVNCHIFLGHKAGYVFVVDYTNKKMMAYQQSAATGALTEVPNATNLSAVTGVHFVAFGVLA